MFLMLGCALPIYNQYWPLFVLFFYILSPIPYCIARRLVDDTDAMSNACKELAIFLTTGIVVSAFGLPIVFARAHLIEWGACALVLTGNTVIFATILGFFLVFGSNDDFSWQQWWEELLHYCQVDFLSFVGHPRAQELGQGCWVAQQASWGYSRCSLLTFIVSILFSQRLAEGLKGFSLLEKLDWFHTYL